VLARAIEAVARQAPRAIGLDVYRDGAVMPGTPELERVLSADQRVIAIMKHPEAGAVGVLPPRVLRGTERAGFSDILVDPGGVGPPRAPVHRRRSEHLVCVFAATGAALSQSTGARSTTRC
jgi:CHASE2 domain-containing sensor protein